MLPSVVICSFIDVGQTHIGPNFSSSPGSHIAFLHHTLFLSFHLEHSFSLFIVTHILEEYKSTVSQDEGLV